MLQKLKNRSLQILYVMADAVATELVWFLFLYFRWLVLDDRITNGVDFLREAFTFSINTSFCPFVLFPFGCFCIYYLSGYYLRPGSRNFIQLIINTFVTALVISLGSFFVIIIDDLTSVAELTRYYYSVGVLILFQFIVVLIERMIVHSIWHRYTLRERVVLTPDDHMSEMDLYRSINELFPTGKEIAIVPRTFDLLNGAAKITNIQETPLIIISDLSLSDAEIAIKRFFDFFLSGMMLVLLSPVYLIIAVIVRLDSPGPIIYRQERVGMYGRCFTIYKFRTMYDGAEESTPLLTKLNDARVTRVGRFLRKYRLDELPQFVNVLKGDMSLVGPRPERQYFIDLIMQQAPYYCLLYKVRPGLTSWGPIKVGYTDTIDKMIERLKYDIAYVENMSLLLDLRILCCTIKVLVDGRGQ